MDNAAVKLNHTVLAENRKKVMATGIKEVTSYDGNTIVANSDAGDIIIQGKQLHINNFDQSSGKLSIDGVIDSIQYVDVRPKNESFFSRLLK